MKSFVCNCCGILYDEMPLCFGSDFPDFYFSILPEERESRVEITDSLCVIGEHFFHRGRLSIPIVNYPDPLEFNVWTTISQDNFILRNDLWNDPHRVAQRPYFGWLQTQIYPYQDTLNIRTVAHEQPVGYIPIIEVIAEDHQLFYDQQNGITLSDATERVQILLAKKHK